MATATLRGWGRSTASAAHLVPPPSVDGATQPPVHPRGALARGMARSYGDAATNAGGVVLDMPARSRLRAFDGERGTLLADAGATLDEALRAVVPHGWFLPVTPGTRMITLGGALAADVHGKNHSRAGSIRRHVAAFTLLLADGGRRRVTPEDVDVFAATLGGMGLTGVVLDVELALRPITSAWVRVHTRTTDDLDATFAALDGATAEHRIATLDLMRRGSGLGRGIVETGDHADAAELDDAGDPLAYDATQRVAVPDAVPGGLLNRWSARAFTELWFARAPRRPRTHLAPLPAFFHPLDAIADWNRLYGARGFVQYQFAVPVGREDAVRRIAERLAAARCPTFVAVLKRLGPGGGMLSFPIDGWTMAVDIPAGVDGLSDLLEGCDDVVCEAGGRIYLAKDGRLRAARLPVMYPELDRWRAVRDRLDPHGRWRSDLGRRLGLCTP
jgi:decaprenylphospho-beta-D-ribofuranose 2-oxidase